VQHYQPNTPKLLVGTKCDLRNDHATIEKLKQQGQSPVTVPQAEELAKKLKAVKFLECRWDCSYFCQAAFLCKLTSTTVPLLVRTWRLSSTKQLKLFCLVVVLVARRRVVCST